MSDYSIVHRYLNGKNQKQTKQNTIILYAFVSRRIIAYDESLSSHNPD